MQRVTKNTLLFILMAFISISNINQYKCSQVSNYNSESLDPYNDDIEYQRLADEINRVDDYMRIVADQLINDGVIIVRATATEFSIPDTSNPSKSEILALEARDFGLDQPEEALVAVSESDIEDSNISSTDEKFREIHRTTDFEKEHSAETKFLPAARKFEENIQN